MGRRGSGLTLKRASCKGKGRAAHRNGAKVSGRCGGRPGVPRSGGDMGTQGWPWNLCSAIGHVRHKAILITLGPPVPDCESNTEPSVKVSWAKQLERRRDRGNFLVGERPDPLMQIVFFSSPDHGHRREHGRTTWHAHTSNRHEVSTKKWHRETLEPINCDGPRWQQNRI